MNLRQQLPFERKADLGYLPWAAFILLIPFYFWSSGLPQVSDILMVLIIGGLFIKTRLDAKFDSVTKPLLVFVIYTIFVNLAWTLLTDEPRKGFRPYHYSLFYIYNFLLLLTCLTLFRKNARLFFLWTSYAVGTSLVVQALLTSLRGGASRHEGFFNNPNQFGYYALLSATIFAITAQRCKINPAFQAIVLISAIYIAALSLSKAALGGILLLFCFFAVQKGYFQLRQIVAVALCIATVGVFAARSQRGQEIFSNVKQRVERVGGDDSLEGRGYHRILQFPQYTILGAGEGALYRFSHGDKEMEIHSSFGTIFFCYGVVGFSLMGWFLYRIWLQTGARLFMFIVPALAYGVTHMGLRFTSLWIMLGCLCAASESEKETSGGNSNEVYADNSPLPWKSRRKPSPKPAEPPPRSAMPWKKVSKPARELKNNHSVGLPWSRRANNASDGLSPNPESPAKNKSPWRKEGRRKEE